MKVEKFFVEEGPKIELNPNFELDFIGKEEMLKTFDALFDVRERQAARLLVEVIRYCINRDIRLFHVESNKRQGEEWWYFRVKVIQFTSKDRDLGAKIVEKLFGPIVLWSYHSGFCPPFFNSYSGNVDWEFCFSDLLIFAEGGGWKREYGRWIKQKGEEK